MILKCMGCIEKNLTVKETWWLMNKCLKYKINYLWLQLLKVMGGGCLRRINKMEIHTFENLKN